MRRRLSGVIVVAVLALSASVALAAPDIERLELELSDYEWVPNRAALDRHGPTVEAMLRHIVRQTRRPLARSRAIGALSLYRSTKTRRLLLQLIHSNQTAKGGVALIDLRHALTAYATVAGSKALSLAKRFLSHKSLDVRCAAATAIRLTRSSKAPGLLSAQLAREKSPTVRAELKHQIKLIRRSPSGVHER